MSLFKESDEKVETELERTFEEVVEGKARDSDHSFLEKIGL